MDEIRTARMTKLTRKLLSYGKENLEDILHLLVDATTLLTRQNRCRIYLEDLTAGQLTCAAVTGPHAEEIRAQSFPINSEDFLVSRVYTSQDPALLTDIDQLDSPQARAIAARLEIGSSCHLPLIHQQRAVGVLCLDSGRRGQLPGDAEIEELRQFLLQATPVLDRARKYHQQILLAREIDTAKSQQAALFMVRSAVRLIDKLALASVLVPRPGESEDRVLEILASYSPDIAVKRLYEDEKQIELGTGRSLLSRYIHSDGTIRDDKLLKPIYIENLPAQTLQKRYLTDQMGLQSLYVVPRLDPHSRRVRCLVNYYTAERYRFSPFEQGLLEAHAEMAERVIQEIGGEHMEIQVLAEINTLLQEKYENLPSFLNRVLAKATELIGADTGSIALVREREGERWLVVEENDGTLTGAKIKEWLKRNIPPIRIGAEELPAEERSLTGLAAATGREQLITDTREEAGGRGFYREITTDIRSELAVPVMHDDEVLAVICLDSLRPWYFTAEHRQILQIIQRMISRHLFDLQRIEQLTSEVEQLRSDVGYRDPSIHSYRLGNIIGNAPRAREIVEFIQQVTPPIFNRITLWHKTDVEEATLGLPSILITGETGSGKEFIFNNIFSRLNEMYQGRFGRRRELPVKKTNIAAYSGELTYSELFGHKRGAYTGAHADRQGILEEAHGGVVFLDEIGDADPKTQVQLLRFLDNGGFVRLGDNQTRYARVLLIAATNKDLGKLIEAGDFREDLYHRLSELTIEVPSLNQRREDIPDLATHFLGRLYRIYRRPGEPAEPPMLTRGAREELARHHYSGNIRELRSILVRALFFRDGHKIDEQLIRHTLGRPHPAKSATPRQTTRRLTEELAEQILESITSGQETFWTALYNPYSENRITRDMVLAVLNLARRQGATSMPKLAGLLHACDPKSDRNEERKTFFRFKNFLYKTIRIQ
ncbi:Fis family transcriptional regulator [Geothermobacter hydrogeniphilus]|uniref:Fis family transcriptional regulator n=1 Tax=Geothermobacter hydrogeniphilus TaxID=1969733 RepID=A0A2K2H5H7_9BACT|nr:GPMC system transcriptional regulator [Geothermobacter hydrogeniphilus]PNU18584.1 Fis family transcriptional regulator [Geothermobacter hydrogeniphilus]